MAKGDKKPVVMTEDIDQSVAKKLHASQHASDGSDPITPAAIGAVSKLGDIVRGWFHVTHDSLGYGTVSGNHGGAYLETWKDDLNKRRHIALYNTEADANDATALRMWNSATSATHTILHTGNKPSGSYTGNGDATREPIDTKGIGHVVLIYTSVSIALVTATGALCCNLSDGTVVAHTKAKFMNGILTLTTDGGFVNFANNTYNYQVL